MNKSNQRNSVVCETNNSIDRSIDGNN